MLLSRVRVRVPATSANLGPGFDCLGMALNIHNTVTVARSQSFGISIAGEGAETLSQGHDSLIYQAISRLYQELEQEPPVVQIDCDNSIPLRRGLGSSAAAIVAGLVAANELAGRPFPQERLADLGWTIEGHPDNVVAALFGGCQVAALDDGKIVHASVPLPPQLRAVLFIPDFEMSTRKSRAALPQQVSRADAVFNMGRVALLVTALITGELGYLRVATQDRLHQPQRQALFPAMPDILEAALSAGAPGVFLSGSGSSILALAESNCDVIASAMADAAARRGIDGKTMVTQPSLSGAQVIGC